MTARRKIAPVSRQQGQTRVRGLRCFQEVDQRIKEGWPLKDVAKFIQEVKEEMNDITRASVVSQLLDYRASIPPAELMKPRIPRAHVKAAEKVEEGLDELHELQRLYTLQMGRIEIDLKNEKTISKLLPTTGQEVRIAKEILVAYKDLKMDLGLSKRHIGQLDVDARLMADVAVRYNNKPEVQQVMHNAESRKKILNLVERLLSRPAAQLTEGAIDVPGEVVEATPAAKSPYGPSEDLFPEEAIDVSGTEID